MSCLQNGNPRGRVLRGQDVGQAGEDPSAYSGLHSLQAAIPYKKRGIKTKGAGRICPHFPQKQEKYSSNEHFIDSISAKHDNVAIYYAVLRKILLNFTIFHITRMCLFHFQENISDYHVFCLHFLNHYLYFNVNSLPVTKRISNNLLSLIERGE